MTYANTSQSFLAVAFLAINAVQVSAQFGPFGAEGTQSSTTCTVDITTVRVDPTLGERCDPATQGDNLCDSCICDLSHRLLEAGYAVRGPDAISFETCAFTHLATLQRKGGVTLTGMMRVASQCDFIPDCIAELEEKYNPSTEVEEITTGDVSDVTDVNQTDAAARSTGDPADPNAAAVNPEDAPDGSQAQELLRAVADIRSDVEQNAAPATGDLRSVDGEVISSDPTGSGDKNAANEIAAAVAPSVIAAVILLFLAWYVHRERRRVYLAALHLNALEESAVGGATELVFVDVTCAARGGSGGVVGVISRLIKKSSIRATDDFSNVSVLLSHVSGSCARGEMLAIMGPSGAGKSTLLDVLAGRTETSVTGVVKVGGSVSLSGPSGASLRATQLSRAVAYVPQDDTHLLSYLTVFETVLYSAELQLPWFVDGKEKRTRVADTLSELGLTSVGDSLVGGGGRRLSRGFLSRGGWTGANAVVAATSKKHDVETGRNDSKGIDASMPHNTSPQAHRTGGAGVSGGERRRTAVAVELVASPSALALDEPTSGLDASAATSMIFTLRHLASSGSGRVVIFSVHQPSPRAFRQMDKVLLLAPGGTVLWHGRPEVAASTFRELGVGCPEPDTDTNSDDSYRVDISEWMLEVASSPELREKLTSQDTSDAPSETTANVKGNAHKDGDNVGAKESKDASSHSSIASPKPFRSFATELRVLLWRAFTTLTRDPSLAVAHLLVGVGTSTLLGCLYLKSPKTLAGFQNRAGGLFFTLVFFGLASVSASDRLAAETKARARELQSGYHGCLSYVIASLVSDIVILRVPAALCYTLILYYMMGLKKTSEAFFIFLGIVELFVVCSASLTSLIALSYRGSPAVANLIATFTLLLSAMFGGFLISIDSIPVWLRWMQWISVYRYAWGALLSNEMRNQVFLFDTDFEGTMIEVDVSGQTYLNTFGLHPKHIQRDAGALAGIFAGTAVLAWLALKRAS